MSRIRCLALLAFAVVLAWGVRPAAAQEMREVRIAIQFGIAYAPFLVAEKHDLIGRHAKAAGLGAVKTTIARFSGAPAVNDALLSGNVDLGSYGTTGFITAWDRSRGSVNVKGLCNIAVMPSVMNAIRPGLKRLGDLTQDDRIAVPSTTSPQAVTLRMAAEREFGPGQQNRLDPLMVTLPHPDGVRALLSSKEISAHVTSPPFDTFEREDARVTRVFTAEDLLGGPSSFLILATTDALAQKNPGTMRAILAALGEAMEMIRGDPRAAAETYIAAEKATMPLELVERLLRDPANTFTLEPVRLMKYVEFMQRTGALKNRVADWRDMFLPLIHDRAGS
jgi:NitT/TauT family transport system substrate-binding protein